MSSKTLRVLMAVAAAMLLSCTSDNSVYFTVQGKVMASFDSNEGLANVIVSCSGSTDTVMTASDGTFALQCSVEPDADWTEGDLPSVMVWFEREDLAPVFKTLIPVEGERFTIVPVMHKAAVSASVELPAGNTTIPYIMQSATVSFARETMLDVTGMPVTGTIDFPAADWDSSLPFEVDESSGLKVSDIISPAYTRYYGENDDIGTWMRPIAAVWFNTLPNVINPEAMVELQLSTRFADDVLGRELEAGDANLYLVDKINGRLLKNDHTSLSARNQITAQLDKDGLWVWMAPDDSHACILVTIKKGDLLANGAHVSAFEIFNDAEQIFYDEQIGSFENGYWMRVPSGKEIRIKASVATETGVETKSADVISGGEAPIGPDCTDIHIVFPCEIKENCDPGRECIEGTCQVVEPV